MDPKFLKVVILAAVSDGEIQYEELEMLNQIKDNHPELKTVSHKIVQEAMAEIYNQVSAGMEISYIIQQLGESFSEIQKHSAYALAREVCAADFQVQSSERNFLTQLEEIWSVPENVIESINKSIELRYFT